MRKYNFMYRYFKKFQDLSFNFFLFFKKKIYKFLKFSSKFLLPILLLISSPAIATEKNNNPEKEITKQETKNNSKEKRKYTYEEKKIKARKIRDDRNSAEMYFEFLKYNRDDFVAKYTKKINELTDQIQKLEHLLVTFSSDPKLNQPKYIDTITSDLHSKKSNLKYYKNFLEKMKNSFAKDLANLEQKMKELDEELKDLEGDKGKK